MPTIDAVPGVLEGLTRDGLLLFFTRFMRLFAYGSLSVVLVFYLIALGLSESQTGLLLTVTLAGDVAVSLYLTTRADRIGRRRMLIVGAILMAGVGAGGGWTHSSFRRSFSRPRCRTRPMRKVVGAVFSALSARPA